MNFFVSLSDALWNPCLLILFFLVGGYYSFRTGFFQLFNAKQWMGSTIGRMFSRSNKNIGKGKLTQFQAMATALGSTVGTSSIAGVATAIYFGGPGAVFWMLLSAFVGMMTGYAEKVLAIHYRIDDGNGGYKGGPAEYIRRGLHSPFFAKFFCVACILASFSGGNLVQANSIASGVETAFGISSYTTGLLIVVFTAVVVLGGIERIGQVSSKLVPIMAVLFTVGGICVLIVNAAAIPEALIEILASSCSFTAVVGGGAGFSVSNAMRYGVARGVFTNEAGLGSSGMAHATAQVEKAHTQGMWGILEVFLATFVIATVSALVILTGGVYHSGESLRMLNEGVTDTAMIGVPLVVNSFASVMGRWAGPFISICLTLFAISSILGWEYYGERCTQELFGGKILIRIYRTLFFACLFVGSISDVAMVWEIADLFNGMMALPNLIALLLLSPKVMEIWRREESGGKDTKIKSIKRRVRI